MNQTKLNKNIGEWTNRVWKTGSIVLSLFIGLAGHPPVAFSQCTPTAATLCSSSDDNSTIYVGGVSIGYFPYAGALGTGDAGTPTCVTVPTSLLTGAQVCLAVYTQNTAPQVNFSSWDLDITCAGGNHSEITS